MYYYFFLAEEAAFRKSAYVLFSVCLGGLFSKQVEPVHNTMDNLYKMGDEIHCTVQILDYKEFASGPKENIATIKG